MLLSDLRGDGVAIAPPLAELIGADLAVRDWFKGAKRTGKPYVSSGFRSIVPGNPLAVGVATPVFHGNTRIGYLAILGRSTRCAPSLRAPDNDDGVTIAVTDQTGQVLNNALPIDRRGQPTGSASPTHRAGARRPQHHPGRQAPTSPPPARSPASAGPSRHHCPPRSQWPQGAFRRSLGLTLGAALFARSCCSLRSRSGPPAAGQSSTTWSKSNGPG